MFYNIDPTQTKAWKKLAKHYQHTKDRTIKELFKEDKSRFDKYHLTVGNGDILVDYSKNIVDEETLSLLLDLAEETKLKDNRSNAQWRKNQPYRRSSRFAHRSA